MKRAAAARSTATSSRSMPVPTGPVPADPGAAARPLAHEAALERAGVIYHDRRPHSSPMPCSARSAHASTATFPNRRGGGRPLAETDGRAAGAEAQGRVARRTWTLAAAVGQPVPGRVGDRRPSPITTTTPTTAATACLASRRPHPGAGQGRCLFDRLEGIWVGAGRREDLLRLHHRRRGRTWAKSGSSIRAARRITLIYESHDAGDAREPGQHRRRAADRRHLPAARTAEASSSSADSRRTARSTTSPRPQRTTTEFCRRVLRPRRPDALREPAGRPRRRFRTARQTRGP